MGKHIKYWYYILTIFLFNSCGSHTNAGAEESTEDNGTIHISADESFKPVINSQIQVYESSHPQTKIIAHYKPEADCLRDFAVDSITAIIATRGYSKNEEIFLEDSMKVVPQKITVAFDAIAVIVNPQAADSLFTVNEIKDLITGKASNHLVPVFDGVKATSTVRFMIDSVLKGQPLGTNVVAANSSEGVIDYVSKNKNAVGFLGVSWVGNKEDTTQLSFLKKIKLASLESLDKPGAFVQPVQANIYYKRYPLLRNLMYVLKEKHNGLAHGFTNFLTNQRGQLIFKRAYLMPALIRFSVRAAELRD